VNTTLSDSSQETAPSGIAGAIVAVLLGLVVVAALYVLVPGGATGLTDRPDVLAAGIALSAALGWRVGSGIGHGGWLSAIGRGIVFGCLWTPAVQFVFATSALVDSTIRGAGNPLVDMGPALIWALYAVVVLFLYSLLVALPVGILWGLLTRLVSRVHIGTPGLRPVRRTARLFAALGVIALVSGAGQAAATAPPNTSCLDLDGGSAMDAAFSPAGDLLAVVLQSDPNAQGTITLLHWPSGEVVESWTAWVDEDVALDPSGRIFWSAWVLGLSTYEDGQSGDGIYAVAPGSSPTLLVGGDETQLNDLTWTEAGLRGTTPNSHRVATIGVTGEHDMDITPHRGEAGAFWASPDNAVSAVGGSYGDLNVAITSAAGTRSIDAGAEPRSISLSPDGRSLVVASWFGGTRVVDTETGSGHPVLRGSQKFVALSAGGYLVWANDEQLGQDRLCLAKLADL
jgi:hypothetical protein